MKPSTKYFFKIFLITGLPFAIGMSVWDIADGSGFQITKFLFMFLFFGFFMAITLTTFHNYGLEKLGITNPDSSHYTTKQIKLVRSNLSLEKMSDLLQQNPRFKNLKMDPVKNNITASTSISSKTWGDKIEVNYQGKEGEDHSYEIKSRPKLITTVTDYGSNLENIIEIEKLIKDS